MTKSKVVHLDHSKKKMSGGWHGILFWCFWPHRKYENKKQGTQYSYGLTLKKKGDLKQA